MTPIEEPDQVEVPEPVTKHKSSRRVARTGLQVITGGVVVGAITELTGWEPEPYTAIVVGGLGTVVAAWLQNVIEGATGRTLPGPLADSVHRQLGDPVVGTENIAPTDTSAWDGRSDDGNA